MSRFALLLTLSQAAQRLGVPPTRFYSWLARGLVPIAGQDEDGRALVRENTVARLSEKLAAGLAPETLVPKTIRFEGFPDTTRPATVLRAGASFRRAGTNPFFCAGTRVRSTRQARLPRRSR